MLNKVKKKRYFERSDEPEYARLPNYEAPQKNRYGKPIDLAAEDEQLKGLSLNINGDTSVGEHPNRYKQHGFYFNADNCISCHACESACSEKNGLPPYLAYRAVGYVEGGTYPNYTRLNISMACNHCDNPVCLKGCPTRAYTKYAEYGAVLQDPDICFGCGYCTWVCPYNAPQLDIEKGHVHKCNMCVDRLEVGLKPACASACLAGALDFGVIETRPENREQLATQIPGFPTPEITHPNIRFQQTKTLPGEMTRPDAIPLRYERDDQGQGSFKTKLRDVGKDQSWNLKKLLSSHENAHIAFTLASQTVMGAFLLLFLGSFANVTPFNDLERSSSFVPLLASMLVLLTFGLVKLNLHLGRPHRFYRGFNNLRYSPVSREIAGVSLFFGGLIGFSLFSLLEGDLSNTLRSIAAYVGIIGLILGSWYMYKLYRIPARPFWNHWQTGTQFWGSSLTLGALLIAIVSSLLSGLENNHIQLQALAFVALIGLCMEAIGYLFHWRDMQRQGGEGAASHYEQTTTYGKSHLLRNGLLIINLIALTTVSITGLSGYVGITVGILLGLSILSSSIITRALFYVLVIPTTMPGAFFWRNKGFQEHAQESGLANMPQVGVLPKH
ncbi:MAG: dimethyl sulfoxide reductase anchor subunit [Gammaproteobacteria bacterium]|nr:dimethyl sulfoxide reductase anchor subunit [Gammaproteobacteria bacterium]MDH5777847.1 dimethyl sulfoxide reductase anchor subunit [Gammaproteobacteria bacterium]